VLKNISKIVFLTVFRRHLNGYDPRPALRLFLALVLCGILLLPYIYSITHAKTQGEAIPIGLSLTKMIGLFVSCALVIFLSAFQARRIFRSRDLKTYFLLYATATILFICTILQLPGANSNDKFPFLIFFPLAVVGGWTLAEFSARAASDHGRIGRYVLVCLLAFGPLNIFMFAGYYNTPPKLRHSQNELDVAKWVRAETSRDAIMIDSKRGGLFLVRGPRRHYFAAPGYAEIWGYDRSEVEKRNKVKNDLYSRGPLEPSTLRILGEMRNPIYIIVRSLEDEVDSSKFEQQPGLFRHMLTSGSISVFEVDRDACRAAAEASGRTD